MELRREIEDFINGDPFPVFWGYYSDYDWVVFCWLWGCMVDLPRNFPKFCLDLKQVLVEMGEPDIKPPTPENAHNALVDAHWNLSLYRTIQEQKTGVGR